MFTNVITYRRWSTLEQGNSDKSSDDRQIQATERFCDYKNWTITESLVDAGRSAYTGANLTNGALGSLTKRILTSAIDGRETVLVVEELDRLSRRPASEMMAWMTPLLAVGLTIAVANTGQIITKQSMDNDIGSFFTIMSAAFAAYEFSRKQSERGNGSWNKRRKAAEEGKNLSRHRARGWLEWNSDIRDYEPIEERAAIVREIFAMRLKSVGKSTIAKILNQKAANDQRYRPFTSSKVPPKLWTKSMIDRIVHDQAVTGYVQYHRNPRGAEKKEPIGAPVRVYPAIVDQETFARANDKRFDEQVKANGRSQSVSNIFGPLARCGTCGGTVSPMGSARWHTNKDGSRSQWYFFYCSTAKMTKGAECTHQRGWTVNKVEKVLLDNLLALAIDDQHFATDDTETMRLEARVIQLTRTLGELEKRATRMFKLMGNDPLDLEIAEYEATKDTIRATKADLTTAKNDLANARGTVSPAEHIVRVSEVRARMDSEDIDQRRESRMLVRQALAGIIDEMTFYPDGMFLFPDRPVIWVELLAGAGNLFIFPDSGESEFRMIDDAGLKTAVDSVQSNSPEELDRLKALMRRAVNA